MKLKTRAIVPWFLILIGAVLRILPHPWNFTPIAAIALFGGTYLQKKYALIIPLVAMLLGDLYRGFYQWPIMLSVYGSFVLIGLIGLVLRRRKNLTTVIGASLSASLSFFLITNFAVWAFSSLYPRTLVGLIESYTMAIPFFRGTLLGDLFYAGLFFGSYELISYWAKKKELGKEFNRA